MGVSTMQINFDQKDVQEILAQKIVSDCFDIVNELEENGNYHEAVSELKKLLNTKDFDKIVPSEVIQSILLRLAQTSLRGGLIDEAGQSLVEAGKYPISSFDELVDHLLTVSFYSLFTDDLFTARMSLYSGMRELYDHCSRLFGSEEQTLIFKEHIVHGNLAFRYAILTIPEYQLYINDLKAYFISREPFYSHDEFLSISNAGYEQFIKDFDDIPSWTSFEEILQHYKDLGDKE